MITVPEAARRIRRNPETVRRWIRDGRLPSTRIGTQYLVDEQDLDALEPDELLPVPPGWWETMPDGRPLPDYLTVLRRQRSEH